jgi:hypothetical protein
VVGAVAEGGSPYAAAIDATRESIVQRARLYKWLVISVALGTTATVAAVLMSRSMALVAAAFALPALVIAHRLADLRVVHRWRNRLIADWASGALDVVLLVRTLRQVPALPAGTVEGMLETLPAWDAGVPALARAPLARTQSRLGTLAEATLACHLVAWSTLSVASGLGAMTRQWAWVGLALAGQFFALAGGLHIRRALGASAAALRSALALAGDEAAAGRVSLHGLSSAQRAAWRRSATGATPGDARR